MAQTPKPDSDHKTLTANPLTDFDAVAAAAAAAAAAGLIVANSDAIRSFLRSAESPTDSDPHLSPELRELASSLSSQSSVPYKPLRAIWSALPIGSRPPLARLFAGSEFVFSSPKPREKSEELKARLRKLEEMQERKAYAELVKDITPKEAAEPFSSYKDQLGFGLHVVLIMFTGYLVGYALFRALFNHSAVMNAAGGITGLVFGMLVETLLFIIRTSNQDKATTTPTSKRKKQL